MNIQFGNVLKICWKYVLFSSSIFCLCPFRPLSFTPSFHIFSPLFTFSGLFSPLSPLPLSIQNQLYCLQVIQRDKLMFAPTLTPFQPPSPHSSFKLRFVNAWKYNEHSKIAPQYRHSNNICHCVQCANAEKYVSHLCLSFFLSPRCLCFLIS